ncbi:hypothetical protein, partial [Bartonella schoenbuchensis]|uniref:hypothetical protein n=1 Tax=Bartonella schoenbuchensis TaxID=165694 RepID=UPI001ABA9D14
FNTRRITITHTFSLNHSDQKRQNVLKKKKNKNENTPERLEPQIKRPPIKPSTKKHQTTTRRSLDTTL